LLLSHTTDFTDDGNGERENAQRQPFAGLALAVAMISGQSTCTKFVHPEREGMGTPFLTARIPSCRFAQAIKRAKKITACGLRFFLCDGRKCK